MGNTLIFFFWYGIQWNSADQNGGIHVLFGYKSLKYRGGIHWNQGILAKLEASAKIPGFNETTTGFKLLTQKHVKPPFWSAEFHWNRTKKKNERFPY